MVLNIAELVPVAYSRRSVACENSCPPSLPARVALRETPLAPGAKKDGCFHRLGVRRNAKNCERKMGEKCGAGMYYCDTRTEKKKNLLTKCPCIYISVSTRTATRVPLSYRSLLHDVLLSAVLGLWLKVSVFVFSLYIFRPNELYSIHFHV